MRARAALVVLAITAAAPARADDAAVAQQLYEQAKQLEADGKLDQACALFAQSFKVDPALGVELNLADCHEKQGKLATAYAEFRDAVSRAQRKHDDREAYAAKRADALAPKLVRLHITPPQHAIVGLAVKLDDSDVTVLVGTDMPVDPGTHVLVASAPGYTSATQVVTIDPARALTEASVPELAKAAAVADATQMTPEQIAAALDARAKADQRARDDRLARVRRHVRITLSAGAGIAGGIGSPGTPPGVAELVAIGARYGIGGSLELDAALLYVYRGDTGPRSEGGETIDNLTWSAPAIEVILRGRPLSTASHWYVGFGGRASYVMIRGHASTAGPLSGDSFAPAAVLETGIVLGDSEHWDLTILRWSIGSVANIIPPGNCTSCGNTDVMLVGTVQLGYTFF